DSAGEAESGDDGCSEACEVVGVSEASAEAPEFALALGVGSAAALAPIEKKSIPDTRIAASWVARSFALPRLLLTLI
ncbi:hypothetical protein, partial [Brooklawnia sp.]|uniref:hypothetical protein n=1 Tax=Brooklawnia sp. TaxID=2699740 RepID=UPI00311E75C3